MPPAAGGAAAPVGEPAPSALTDRSAAPAHCPAASTRSAAVIGRSSKSLLPPEKVAQSGLRSTVSGLGTRVTLLRPRSDEQPPIAAASPTIATMPVRIRPTRCIAKPLSTEPVSQAASLLGLRPRLCDSNHDQPGNPKKQKIHGKKDRQACRREGLFDREPDEISDE